MQLYKLTTECTTQANEETRTLVGYVCCSYAIVDTLAMIPWRDICVSQVRLIR